MSEQIPGQPIDWYWIPIDRKVLTELSRKSDLRGALQTFGFLAVLGCTGSAAYYWWHMNYHTDHHFYAAVPCYRLAGLHRVIREDLPPCPRGLLATWREINSTLQRQKVGPGYRYSVPAPPRRQRGSAARTAHG